MRPDPYDLMNRGLARNVDATQKATQISGYSDQADSQNFKRQTVVRQIAVPLLRWNELRAATDLSRRSQLRRNPANLLLRRPSGKRHFLCLFGPVTFHPQEHRAALADLQHFVIGG